MRVVGHRYQRTLAEAAEIRGVGFITGACVRARFLPAAPDTGIVFRRTDLPGTPTIAARAGAVTGTQRRTTLGPPPHGITLVEHLLAALAGLRIDNVVVELDGPEPPGLDGSAAGFVAVLESAGTVIQFARRAVWAVSTPVVVEGGGATIGLHPADGLGLRASYLLDYGLNAAIPKQSHTLDVRPENFVSDVSNCRTFLTEPEAHQLRSAGVGTHLTPAEVLVFGSRGPIENELRFANEPARHKLLDLIGDLALCGFDLAGHVVAYRSGHSLNVELAKRLTALACGSTKPLARVKRPVAA